jgi:hypothetical protein
MPEGSTRKTKSFQPGVKLSAIDRVLLTRSLILQQRRGPRYHDTEIALQNAREERGNLDAQPIRADPA